MTSLSNKIQGNMFRYIDVKEFIRKLKEEIKLRHGTNILDLLPEIDKLIGKELVKGGNQDGNKTRKN